MPLSLEGLASLAQCPESQAGRACSTQGARCPAGLFATWSVGRYNKVCFDLVRTVTGFLSSTTGWQLELPQLPHGATATSLMNNGRLLRGTRLGSLLCRTSLWISAAGATYDMHLLLYCTVLYFPNNFLWESPSCRVPLGDPKCLL